MDMGLVYADIELIRSDDMALLRAGFLSEDKVKRVKIKAMVDSGAYMLSLNESICSQLDLPLIRKSSPELADGSVINLDIVGPVEVRFENRSTTVEAMVLPGGAEALLGAIPMEGMDVLIDPLRQRLIVNPEHPFKPQYSLK